jgi:ribonuclease Z
MALCDDVLANLRGHSKAMYSTWFHYKPARLLFDAGEGVSSQMENFVFGIEAIFLSHGHYDHIGGIGGIVHSRASARGDKEKPLAIYYPAGDRLVELMKSYVSQISDNVKYDLEWKPTEPGDVVTVGSERERGLIQCFPVFHSTRTVNVGWRLFERRTKLRPELQGKPQEEIEAIANEHGQDAVCYPYEQIILAYCGDSAPVLVDEVKDAEVLMHDATFIKASDRAHEAHSTIAEAMEVAKAADVKALVLMHISTRYQKREIESMVRRVAREQKFDRQLQMAVGSRIIPLLGPGGREIRSAPPRSGGGGRRPGGGGGGGGGGRPRSGGPRGGGGPRTGGGRPPRRDGGGRDRDRGYRPGR